jgi:hypothetical protein
LNQQVHGTWLTLVRLPPPSQTPQRPDSVDNELVEELVEEIQHIKGNSGVGSPEEQHACEADE